MDRLKAAFYKINRADFLPSDSKALAGFDVALPIGYGQTISQPSTVALMLEWLNPQPGDKVLDVGSGSGWTTTLLSYLVGPEGKVEAVELIPQLLALGKRNALKYSIKIASFHLAKGELGWPKEAPYDSILVSAATKELPQELIDQLKTGGKMVIPVSNDVLEVTKETDKKISIIEHPGFIFVPLINKT